MGKRFERIPAAQLPARLEGRAGQRIQVLMLSGITHQGLLVEAGPASLVLRSPRAMWYNRRRHTRRLGYGEIAEVVAEYASSW
ncbi:MAG: hypothetical protein NW241_09475 [Bacteroidia bacterium]|nr:hypothetical protein [Bacteroidia bacterium]